MAEFDITKLNDKQLEITKDTEGAILCTAGAGSGKTRLLTHRICYLISEKHVSPNNILAITFTNKATNEMKERISEMLPNSSGVWISTFHSMCVKILRENIYNLDGYNKYFTIYDEADKDKLIKRIIKEFGLEDDDIKSKISWHISNAKNMGLNPTCYADEIRYEPKRDIIFKIYQKYEDYLRDNNSLDFDDLIVKTLFLFEENPKVLEYYQDKFRYINVDEFQDTNEVQYKLVKLLASKYKNIFVVGDEDQCIYCWRGANIGNIKSFIKDFNAKIYKLEQNYRSTKKIISKANELIKHNISRLEKNLFTENSDGDDVTYYQAYDEQEEAEYVSRAIYNLIAHGAKASNIGVLMRISALSRLFEEKLLNYNIPYNVSGIFKFFERSEIKDILAYLRVVVNPKDSTSLIRIINVPKRNIGNASVEKLLQLAKDNNVDLFTVITNCQVMEMPSSLKSKIIDFSSLLTMLKNNFEEMDLYSFVVNLLKVTGINTMYLDKNDEDVDKSRNIDQFVQSVQSFVHLNPSATLLDYLESVTLQANLEGENEDEEKVSVSTVHASKGLEFDYVFVVGTEEGSFPLSRSLDNPDDLEEERRLMYVAITRARKKLYVTRAKSRFLYGSRSSTVESRFISEMGLSSKSLNKEYQSFGKTDSNYDNNNEWFENENDNNFGSYNSNSFGAKSKYGSEGNSRYGNSGYGYNTKSGYFNSSNESYKPIKHQKDFKPENAMDLFSGSSNMNEGFETLHSANNSSSKFSSYTLGRQVFHIKFGVGKIIALDGTGENVFATIDFGKFGVKKLSLALAPLKLM